MYKDLRQEHTSRRGIGRLGSSKFMSKKLKRKQEGNPFKARTISSLLIKFSAPAVAGMFVSALYNIISRIYVGHEFGAPGIASITLLFPMGFFFMAFSVLIGVGANALFSIRLGEKKEDEAQLILGNAFVALTGMDEENIILGLFAQSRGVPKIVAKVNEDSRAQMVENMGIDSIISAKSATADEIIEATRDFILKELSKNLKGYDLEPFVANLLQAMGYRTILSPHGGDSGIDITAYKDELPPRIVVQVKSQDGDIKETTIQSLKGAMREGDYGLFVTLSNYTKNAQKYLDNTPIIRGINGTELVDLVLKYYDQLSVKYRKMIPLKMVYIPVPPEE